MKTLQFALLAVVIIININNSNGVDVFEAMTETVDALTTAVRFNNATGLTLWLNTVHTDFRSDSRCHTGSLLPFPLAACIEQPLTAQEFYDVNVPFFNAIIVGNTNDNTLDNTISIRSGNQASLLMRTEFVEIFSGQLRKTILPMDVTVALENGKWKVILIDILQETLFEQGLFCRAFLAFFNDDSPCNITGEPNQATLLLEEGPYDIYTHYKITKNWTWSP